jgi:uncharacterized delta-60 repeat protein
MHRSALLCVLAACLVFIAPAAGSSSVPGSLDTSWNSPVGYTTGSALLGINALTTQGGKIVAAGIDSGGQFAVARFRANGTLDTSFGSGGVAATDFGGDFSEAESVTVAGNMIVAAGAVLTGDNGEIVVARYTENGAPAGTGTTTINALDPGGHAIAVHGAHVIVGGSANDAFAVVQFNWSDLSVDTSFGTAGLATTSFDAGIDAINGLAMQDGKILTAGYDASNFALARWTPSGVLDTSFGTGGKKETVFPGQVSSGHALDVKGNRFVVIGAVGNPGSERFAAAMYRKNGALDRKFGNGGLTRLAAGADAIAFGGGFGPSGSVVAAGYSCFSCASSDFAIARWSQNGSRETFFGTTGPGYTDQTVGGAGSWSGASAMALGSNQKIIAAGATDVGFAIARFENIDSLPPAGTNRCDGYWGGTATNVVVPRGATCVLIPGTIVTNGVKVRPGGSLQADGIRIGGSLNAGGNVTVCGSRIGQNVVATGGSLELGGPSCAGNKIGNVAVVKNDHNDVWIWHNIFLDSLSVRHLTGATTSILGNNVFGYLLVAHSGPPVVINNNRALTARCVGNSGLTGSGNRARRTNTCPR